VLKQRRLTVQSRLSDGISPAYRRFVLTTATPPSTPLLLLLLLLLMA